MSNDWQSQKEKTNAFWLKALCFFAFTLGRALTRPILILIALFYYCFASSARRHSRDGYVQITGQSASVASVYRNFLAFAQVAVDRLYFLSGKYKKNLVHINDMDALDSIRSENGGCIVLVSHVGSFDVLRVVADEYDMQPIHILMDTQHNPEAYKLIEALNPLMAKNIIDSRQSPAILALSLKEKIDQGHMIGIMADRLHEGEKSVSVDFCGKNTDFPLSCWQLAAALQVPVIFCIALLNQKNQYDVFFNRLTDKITSNRKERQQAIKALVQSYADTLAKYVQASPDNWFNFYQFWHDE